jgi:hypothetical protein
MNYVLQRFYGIVLERKEVVEEEVKVEVEVGSKTLPLLLLSQKNRERVEGVDQWPTL